MRKIVYAARVPAASHGPGLPGAGVADRARLPAPRARLRGGVSARRFFREIARYINVPWGISAGADLGFPGVTGKRTLKVRLGNAYMARLHTAAAHDARLTEAFFRVAGLIDSPNALMHPRMIMRVMRGSKAQQATAAPAGTHPATLSR
jgi:hypothetical protein